MDKMPKCRLQFKAFSLSDFTEPKLIETVLDIFESLPPELKPVRYGPYEPADRVVHLPGKRHELISAWLNEESPLEGDGCASGSLCLESRSKTRAAYFVDWDKGKGPRFNMISGQTDVSRESRSMELDDFLAMTTDIVTATRSAFALIDREVPLTNNRLSRIDLKVRLPEPCWVMFFGAPYVELFGRERFHLAPCHEVVELPSGHFRLMLSPLPYDPVPDETKNRIREHFGPLAFSDPGRPIRSQKVGVVPMFDFSQIGSPKA